MSPFPNICSSGGLIGIAIMTVWIGGLRQFHHFRLQRSGLHLIRNVCHVSAQSAWFYGLAIIPLATVTAIEFTTPIWTALLAPLLLGERLTRSRLLAVALGFTGILIILRPGMETISLGALAVVAAAFGFALTHITSKGLTRTETTRSIIFYMVVIQTILVAVPAFVMWVPIPAQAWPWLLMLGVAGVTSHYCITQALRSADATIVAPIDFLRLPLIIILALFLYSEAVDMLVLLGAVLIIVGVFSTLWHEKKRAGRK